MLIACLSSALGLPVNSTKLFASQQLISQTNDCDPVQALWKLNISQTCFSNQSGRYSVAFQILRGRKGMEQIDKNVSLYSDT